MSATVLVTDSIVVRDGTTHSFSVEIYNDGVIVTSRSESIETMTHPNPQLQAEIELTSSQKIRRYDPLDILTILPSIAVKIIIWRWRLIYR